VSVSAAIANRLYMAGALAESRRFARALRDPEAAQRETLHRILLANAYSEFGRAHGFLGIRTVAEFRERVAPSEYDDVATGIGRAARGEGRVLTTDPILCFEPTGGSSGANKMVPITRTLLQEFSAATLPWVYDLLVQRPALRDGRAYWAVTPPARRPAATAGGIPIGLEHDSDYFPSFARALLDRVIGAPRALSRVADVESWRYLTLRSLLALPDLTFISVWNPSFLTLLASALDDLFDRLLDDMSRGELSIPLDGALRAELRAALPAHPRLAGQLRRRFGTRPPEDLGDLWENLTLISCWTDAHAARALPAMRRRFPLVEVQGKGLLATEGVVSVPLIEARGSVAAVNSHFLEFTPAGSSSGAALGVHELEVGQTYEVMLTTSGGLYRYRLRDLVRVEGRHHRTPMLSFQGRADLTSDLAGEKLTPVFAEHVLQEAAFATGVEAVFAMLAPAFGDRPRYELLVECDAPDADKLAAAVEERLVASHHYALCRSLGQLDGVHPVVVHDGARLYEERCLARGQRLGAIKPTALDTMPASAPFHSPPAP
jgi:hypothetical protein